MLKLFVLYPIPTDVEQFEKDYREHLSLLHQKLGIPTHLQPYTVTNFLPGPRGEAPYYKMFTMPFETQEAMEAALGSEAMQDVARDANRISSGGNITVLIGTE